MKILTVRIFNDFVHEYHLNGREKCVGSTILKQPLNIVAIKRIADGGGLCYLGQDQQDRWHHLYKSDNPGVNLPVLSKKNEVYYFE